MINQISEEVFTIDCGICEETTAYFYDEISPDEAIEEDSWYKQDGKIVCWICYVPQNPELHLDKWSIQDLLKIANKREYFTRKGIIDHIYAKLIQEENRIDWIPDELKDKYGVIEHE